MKRSGRFAAVLALVMLLGRFAAAQSLDPLPSWNDGPVKSAIRRFVTAVAMPGSPQFVPQSRRIAVFDNDGTLWVEQPIYVQMAFAMDRVKELAPRHPEWKITQPFKAVLEGDMAALQAAGDRGMVELLLATHSGMTTDEFEEYVKDWLATASDPRFHRAYTDLVYQPMLELLAYLRASGFKTFIVSGGSADFMRPWTEQVYGIPPEQVIGSSLKVQYEIKNGKPALRRLPEISFVDDQTGKPIGINEHIGRRPIAAFGNSDGDFQMLEWTTSSGEARLGLIVHHDDPVREYAYDRKSLCGRLSAALDAAPQRGWVVVSMKNDWKKIFPWEQSASVGERPPR